MFRILLQSHRNFFQTGYIPDVAFCTENCTQLDIETDFSVQAIGYEAFFEALSEIHGNGIDVYSTDAYWYWYTDTMLPLNNFPNISHSIRNKPAESVVYYWFSR